MNKRVLLLLGVVSVAGINCADVSAQTNPSCIYPQWEWGQTGPIHHYYSEYVFIPDEYHDCSMSYWDNYDGGPGLEIYDGCHSSKTDCSTGGIGPLYKAKNAVAKSKADPIEYGETSLNSGGYKSVEMLDKDVRLHIKIPRLPIEAIHLIKINRVWGSGDAADKYFKLFQTTVTAPRRTTPARFGDPNEGPDYTFVACTGVEIASTEGVTTVDSASVEMLDTHVFLLNLGRRKFVVRLWGGAENNQDSDDE